MNSKETMQAACNQMAQACLRHLDASIEDAALALKLRAKLVTAEIPDTGPFTLEQARAIAQEIVENPL